MFAEAKGEGTDMGSDTSLVREGICGDQVSELAKARDEDVRRPSEFPPKNDGGEKTFVGPVSKTLGDKGGRTQGLLALAVVWEMRDMVHDEILELLGETFEVGAEHSIAKD